MSINNFKAGRLVQRYKYKSFEPNLINQKWYCTNQLFIFQIFFKKNKSLYYDNLTRVRNNNDLIQWLKFFLEGVRSTSQNSIETFKNIIALRNKIENKITKLGKKQPLAREFLQHLYSYPSIDASDTAKALQINLSTALRLIEDFVKLKILIEITGLKRNRVFIFEDYIKLFR
jgi:Fic family protein